VILVRAVHSDQGTVLAPNQALISGEAWLRANLDPRSRVLVVDRAIKTDLVRLGFPPASITGPDDDLAAFADVVRSSTRPYYALTVPAAPPATAQPSPLVADLMQGASPLAAFGTDVQQVTVVQLPSGGKARFRQQLSKDKGSRRQAGQALSQNTRITADAALSRMLSDGMLDLRAASMLAVLAEKSPLRLLPPPVDPAGRRVGAPIRSIRFIGIPVAALAGIADGLAADFHPLRIHENTDHSMTWTWSPIAAVPDQVGG